MLISEFNLIMSTTNSESEVQRSCEEEDKTENGYSHEENGDMTNNGLTSASWRASSRAKKSQQSLLTLAFPISRVRRLVKSEGDIQWVGVEAGFLIAKATEIFLEKLVEDAFERMQGNGQASILYPHLSSHVASSERLEFLSDIVPVRIPAAAALRNASMTDK